MAFHRDPALVWRFYNLRRASLAKVHPNPGHHALVELERRFGDRFTLVTQNVDGLHQVAGSQRVLEIHGNLRTVRCTGCGQVEHRSTEALPDLPRCRECDALLRPAVVWFQEVLPEVTWEQALQAVAECDCLLVVGTSAVVYPAAGLIDLAHAHGARVIKVNLEPTQACVDLGLYGPSGVLLPQLVDCLTRSRPD
jgi:NAD-dependent deacetylase